MSAIELPTTTRRSLRFKRFSWNRADDGSFPPIDASRSSAQKRAGPAADPPVGAKSAPEPQKPAAPKPAAPKPADPKPPAAAPAADAGAADAAPGLSKRHSKQQAKKRKNVYLGPSWDDEAGTLPTSARADDLDFDSLLSQVQSQRQDGAPADADQSKRNKTEAEA
ncbi:hypothetical protein H4R18_001302 [Coemansia javaensis]|uniref:Uncharacterized protein n=1 Tax=Coemansia javaensis TaxID=2761396 RepID=A0A9W8HK70_9FUNG|nr:hypothetical protein H4R18_001302 [Coemansia javaensis]